MENTTISPVRKSMNESVIYNKFEDCSDILTAKKKKNSEKKITWYFSWFCLDNNIVSKGLNIEACDIQSAIIEWGKKNSGTIIYIQNKSL